MYCYGCSGWVSSLGGGGGGFLCNANLVGANGGCKAACVYSSSSEDDGEEDSGDSPGESNGFLFRDLCVGGGTR
jgi:hypothetical protein